MMGLTLKPLKSLALAGVAAAALSACANTIGGGAALSRDDLLVGQADVAPPAGMDPLAETAFWGSRYDADPANPDTAVKYARALRRIGSLAEAVSVLERAQPRFPDNLDLRIELGKALTADARAFEAVRHLEYAAAKKRDDWALLSAYGVALDQIGEHKTARAQYDAALALSPDNLILLNNKGLSLALAGDLGRAEGLLRDAVAHPDAPATIRQNLALILGLKGNFSEAERLARADLPPPVAENNIAYYRSLLSQPAYWRELQALDESDDRNGQDADRRSAEEEALNARLRAVVAGAPLKPIGN